MIDEEELNKMRAAFASETPPEAVEEPPPSSVPATSLAEMNQLAADIANLRDAEKAAAEAKSKITADLDAKERRVIELLMQNELRNYKAPAGLISLSMRLSAKLPVGPAKTEFYDWLKSQGKFEELATIHSATFTSLVSEMYEQASERGESEPKIPGVTEVKVSPRLSFRRAR